MRSRDAAYAVLHRLTQKAAMRLRSMHNVAGRLSVTVSFVGEGYWQQGAPIDASSDTRHLLQALDLLWADLPAGRRHTPMKVGITLTELTPASARTASLFESHPQQDALNAVVDALNLRFGKNTLYFGGAHLAKDQAPMRIAFTHVPDPKLEE
jgi:DNA polymerase-4